MDSADSSASEKKLAVPATSPVSGTAPITKVGNPAADKNIRRFMFLSRQLSQFVDEIRPGIASPRSSAPVKFRAYLRVLKGNPARIRHLRRLFF